MERIDLHIGGAQERNALKAPINYLPRLERSYSPKITSRSPSRFTSNSEKLLLPDIRQSKCSSRASRLSTVEGSKVSANRCGYMHGYVVNSHSGLSRYKIEQRASVIINIPKPKTIVEDHWPRSSFFGIYDGHSGVSCANFLKERLHNYIFTDPSFPFKVKDSITSAFIRADEDFISEATDKGEMSGSCALITLIIGDKCIVANTGSSHSIVSLCKGNKLKQLNSLHKPENPLEIQRISLAGGSITHNYIRSEKGETVLAGPGKVLPGKLHVTRAFGDLDAKTERYGGNAKVVIVQPEIKSFSITPEVDFLMIATDSLFEKISYREALEIVWKNFNEHKELSSQLSQGIEELALESRRRQITENITIILVSFKPSLQSDSDL